MRGCCATIWRMIGAFTAMRHAALASAAKSARNKKTAAGFSGSGFLRSGA
jgi:hypothetical protein